EPRPALRARRARDGVHRARRAAWHPRPGPVLPRAARSRARGGRAPSPDGARGAGAGAGRRSGRLAPGDRRPRRARPLPLRAGGRRRRAGTGRPRRQRLQVPRRPAGDRAQPRPRAIPRGARRARSGRGGRPAARCRGGPRRGRGADDGACSPRGRAGALRAQRDLRRACVAPVRAVHAAPRRDGRAPVLERRHRRDRHGRDGVGGEHRAGASGRRAAAAAARRRGADVLRARGVAEPGDRHDADRRRRGCARRARPDVRARRRRRRVRRRDRDRPARARLGPARAPRRGEQAAAARLGPV
ncbi:MAG: NrtR-regulated hypothetical NrtY, PpnK-type ATP-NAD kinase domain, partial [uncultured Solirubrobacteraceae bacterium]